MFQQLNVPIPCLLFPFLSLLSIVLRFNYSVCSSGGNLLLYSPMAVLIQQFVRIYLIMILLRQHTPVLVVGLEGWSCPLQVEERPLTPAAERSLSVPTWPADWQQPRPTFLTFHHLLPSWDRIPPFYWIKESKRNVETFNILKVSPNIEEKKMNSLGGVVGLGWSENTLPFISELLS